MQRRSFVAALAAGLPAVAGCMGSPGTGTDRGQGGDPSDTPTDTPGDTPTGTPDEDPGIFDVPIVDLETGPRTYALGGGAYRDDWVSVGLQFTATATADHPATVRATLTNESDYEDTVPLDWKPPFGRHTSTHPREPGSRYRHGSEYTYRASLVFAPTADNDLVETPPGVERDADGYWRASDVADWTPDPLRLSPGESVTADYYLVGHPDGAGQGRPTGVYEFSRGRDGGLTVSVWDSERPGPEGESAFAGASVPSLPGEGETAWYHEAGPNSLSYVRPETEQTDLPAAIPFTFVNHGREGTGCGHWYFYKLVDGEWFDLGPYVRTADCRIVPPGGHKRMTLRAAHGEALDCQGQNMTYGFLGGGRYAFVAGYGIDADRSGALVEFDAPPVEVRPTDDVSATRDGDTVRVESPRYESDDRRVLQVDHAESADERLIAEQVMDRRGLRNTLPFFESGVETVLLKTDRATVRRASGWSDGPTRFRFDGRAYVVTTMSP